MMGCLMSIMTKVFLKIYCDYTGSGSQYAFKTELLFDPLMSTLEFCFVKMFFEFEKYDYQL